VKGDYAAVGGGGTCKALSNYASVAGGYSNKGNARFSSIIGGSKNSVNGRYSTAMGYFAKALGDYSVAIGLNSDASSPCVVDDDYTVGICADKVEVNGMNMLALFSSRRELTERHEGVEKQSAELAKTHSALAKALASQQETLKALDEELNGFDAMAKEFAAVLTKLKPPGEVTAPTGFGPSSADCCISTIP